jgi:hypothetical protein
MCIYCYDGQETIDTTIDCYEKRFETRTPNTVFKPISFLLLDF